jgi:hypothetical protein
VVPPDDEHSRRSGFATRLGFWLDRAFTALLVSGAILYVAVVVAAPVIVWLGTLVTASERVKTAISGLGAASTAAFAWLFVSRGKAKDLALGFRPVLDAMLDVDNWFREHPIDKNPKARICGRYASLLRYVCAWTDPVDQTSRYDAIVIIAHSQGTVISADLLRYIKRGVDKCAPADYDKSLQRLHEIPVLLFTMGCPLRALYGERFPRLYEWAYHADGPDPRQPDPAMLQVRTWTNAYRSGDYIGRYLWRDAACVDNWNPNSNAVLQQNGGRIEFCIGAGAHTHYWDKTAPLVAQELDALIKSVG